MHRYLLLLLGLAGTVTGQAINSSNPAAFEVASLKLSGPGSPLGWTGGPGTKDPGLYTYGRATPLALIMTAYHLDPFQVSSRLPLDKQHFDLVAKVPAGATKAQFRLMLQSLLSDRFHLKAHLESKEFPAYELVVAATGLKLKASVDDPEVRPSLISNLSNGGDGVLVRMKAQQEPISAFSRMIRLPDGSPIVDKTGLTANYSFTFEYTYAPPLASPAAAQPSLTPDIFRALEQQLGLRLVPKKLPFDVLVVDSIEGTPTEN